MWGRLPISFWWKKRIILKNCHPTLNFISWFKFFEKVFYASEYYSKGFLDLHIYKHGYWIDPGVPSAELIKVPPQIVITAALSRATHQSLVTFPNSTRAAWIFHLAKTIHRKVQLSRVSWEFWPSKIFMMKLPRELDS